MANLFINRGDTVVLVNHSLHRELRVVSNGPHGLKLRSKEGYYYGHGAASLKNRLRVGEAVHILVPGQGLLGCDVRHLGRNTVTLRRYLAADDPGVYERYQEALYESRLVKAFAR